jgi:hypothetical protein
LTACYLIRRNGIGKYSLVWCIKLIIILSTYSLSKVGQDII